MIQNKVFLEYIEKARQQMLESSMVPWSSWGPKRTRWFEDSLDQVWLRYVHGERVVKRGPRGCLCILDFARPAWSTMSGGPIQMEEDEPGTSGPTCVIDSEPWDVAAPCFGETVTSALRFRKLLLKDLLFRGFMVDASNGLVVGLDGENDANESKVTVFKL